MENKLISMVEFVSKKGKQGVQSGRLYNKRQTDILFEIYKYANFLKQPLNIGQFVPAIEVGGKWEVLEEPTSDSHDTYGQPIYDNHVEWVQYQNALNNVLFEGFTDLDGINHHIRQNRTVEYFVQFSIKLTENGLIKSGIK